MERLQNLNLVQLRGVVGAVNLSQVAGKKFAQISVATNLAYKDQDGSAVIETTWTCCRVFESNSTPDLDELKKGSNVFLQGRLKNIRYASEDGEVERVNTVVDVTKLEILDKNTLQYEFK